MNKRAEAEFNANAANGLTWSPQAEKSSGGRTRQLYYCAMRYKNKCEFRVAVVREGGKYEIHTAEGLCHADHATQHTKRGVSPAIEVRVTEEVLQKRPDDFVAWATKILKVTGIRTSGLSATDGKALKTYQRNRRSDLFARPLVGGMKLSEAGGIRQLLDTYRESKLAKDGKMTKYDSEERTVEAMKAFAESA